MALRRVEDTEALLGPYDFSSIMHYPWNAFSNSGRKTMVPLKTVSGAPFTEISLLDAQKVSNMYGCKVLGMVILLI